MTPETILSHLKQLGIKQIDPDMSSAFCLSMQLESNIDYKPADTLRAYMHFTTGFVAGMAYVRKLAGG